MSNTYETHATQTFDNNPITQSGDFLFPDDHKTDRDLAVAALNTSVHELPPSHILLFTADKALQKHIEQIHTARTDAVREQLVPTEVTDQLDKFLVIRSDGTILLDESVIDIRHAAAA